MVTISTGLQLVRNFGNGANLRKVITEVIDGKIVTKILNSEGTLLFARTKTISNQVVGDKFIKTVTKELTEKQPHPFLKRDIPFYWGSKTVTDRVYRANDIGDYQKLGERIVYYNRGASDIYHKIGVLKRAANGSETYTRFRTIRGLGDERFDKVIIKNAKRDGDYYKHMRNGIIGKDDYYINYNNLGLPVPNGAHWAEFANTSLKDMLNIHYNIHPGKNYLPNDSGLQALNRFV